MLHRSLPIVALACAALAVVGCDKRDDAPPPPPVNPPAAKDTEPAVGEWVALFDGKSLGDWVKTDFSAGAAPKVEDGNLIVPAGEVMSGITWKGKLPATVDYEIELETMRVDGNDFFCALTFPVGDDPCTLVMGGWGGGITGLSSIDGYDASENATSAWITYKSDRWYKVRLRVTEDNISAWIDGARHVDIDIADHELSIRIEVEASKPLGIATYQTSGAYRNLRMKRIDPKAPYDKGQSPDDPINDPE